MHKTDEEATWREKKQERARKRLESAQNRDFEVKNVHFFRLSLLTCNDAPSSGTASRSTKPSVRSATKPSAAFRRAESLVGLTAPVEASKTMSRSKVPTDAVELRSTLRTTKG